MKVKITRARLLEGLRNVQNIISNKAALPILQNVKLETEEGSLRFTTTDLDITIICKVDCEVVEAGGTTLPVKLLFAAMSKVDEGVVELATDENDQAMIVAGKSRIRLAGKSAAEFPKLGVEEETCVYNLPKATLHEMFRKTAYTASQDETRRALRGVLLSFRASKLTMVATDGRRLAMVEQEVEFPAINEKDIILPSKAVQELMRCLAGEGDVKLTVRRANVCCEVDGIQIFSKLIDDVYPNYRLVIPENCTNVIRVDRQTFINALDRASVLSMDENHSVTLIFNENTLTISSGQSEIGDINDEMPVKYVGEKIEAMYNPTYILEPLKAIDDDEIIFKIENGMTPAIITCSVPFIYVIMPLHKKN